MARAAQPSMSHKQRGQFDNSADTESRSSHATSISTHQLSVCGLYKCTINNWDYIHRGVWLLTQALT